MGRNREQDREYRKRQRAEARDVAVPPCADPRRRARLERDVFAWLGWYFSDTFDEWTEQRREMVRAIRDAAAGGVDQAIAAPRGEGKTTIVECVIIYLVLTGKIRFAVIFSATGPDAERILSTIRDRVEDNERLAADYPEVCVPILALEGNNNRAHAQTVTGRAGRKTYTRHRSKLHWCGREVWFPDVPGSRCSGAIIATRGLDSAVRGLKYGNLRPDLAVIDDPDTDDTSNTDEQAAKLERKIDRNIAGLAGQKRRLARVMLTTLLTRRCVSAKFTDPLRKPSWNGKRFKLLEKPPDRVDLWEEYQGLRQAAQRDGDRYGRAATAFYLANREAMDAGAIVANPSRHSAAKLPDGSPVQVSTLQYCYDLIADIGAEAFATEYQNDPPEEESLQSSLLTARRVQRQLSGFPRRVVPPGCTIVTQGIDVGKTVLHWCVRAWTPEATGFVIDYGVQEVVGTTVGSDVGLDVALRRAIADRFETITAEPYTTAGGEVVPVALTFIDSRWQQSTIVTACREVQAAGFTVFPAIGHGKSRGCVTMRFASIAHGSADRRPGDGYYLGRGERSAWYIHHDADRWKRWEHDRWMTAPTKPGSLLLFGEALDDPDRLSADSKSHHAYAHHIVAEAEVSEIVRGELVQRWKAKSENNHWLDASVLANVAARMRGVTLAGTAAPGRAPGAAGVQRKSLAEVMGSAG